MKLMNLAATGATAGLIFSMSLLASPAQAENIKHDMPKRPTVLTVSTADGTITAEKIEKALTSHSGAHISKTELRVSFRQIFTNLFSSSPSMVVRFSFGQSYDAQVVTCDVTYSETAPDAEALHFEHCANLYAPMLPFYVDRSALFGVSKDSKK